MTAAARGGRRRHDGAPRRIRACWAGDAGTLPLAMLVTLVGMMLSGVLASMVAAQLGATRVEVQRTTALNAAQSGIDVAVARLGDVTRRADLPCGPLEGSVLPPPAGGSVVVDDARFKVRIDYFATDPKALTEAQLAAPAPPGSIGCAAGGGTTSTPAFALLRSTGTDSDGNPRLLRGTYTFRVKNTNVAGGLIHAGGKQGPCLDAGNLPVPSRLLVAAPCAESRPQTFAYNTDLSLSLPSSKSGALPSGLCVTGDGVLGHRVSLQPCAAGAVTQQWAFGTYNHFVGTNDLCLGVGAGPTYPIVLDDDCARMPKWWPEPSVGAGAAGPTTGQMVNFAQFGWCLDLILKRLNLGSTSQPIVQTYQCTQAGPTTEVSWNQKWNPPALPDGPDAASGRLTVTAVGDGPRDDPDNFAPHCLTTPLGAHRYPHLTPCDANATGSRWQFHGENGGYAESFTIVDINGRCLTPETDRDTDESAHVLVAPCDGSALQKWNAPWYTKPPQPLKDISEH